MALATASTSNFHIISDAEPLGKAITSEESPTEKTFFFVETLTRTGKREEPGARQQLNLKLMQEDTEPLGKEIPSHMSPTGKTLGSDRHFRGRPSLTSHGMIG